MNTRSRPRRTAGGHPILRTLGWLASGAMIALAALGPAAGPMLAASVTPIPISSGNPTCASFAPAGETWTEFKLQGDQLANGTYTDGVLVVTITNFVQSASGVPGSFDWAASEGVDAVFVKAGSSRHNLYLYDPESTGDTGLRPQAGNGNGISHISFCYDANLVEPSAEPSVEPSAEPSVEPSAEPSVEPGPASVETQTPSTPAPQTPEATPTAAPFEGAVLGAVSNGSSPTLTAPPTDTDAPRTGSAAAESWRIALFGLGLLIALLLMPSPMSAARRTR